MKSQVILCAAVLSLMVITTVGASPQNATGEYIHYRLAMQYKNEKKYDKAIEEFRKVLAVYPDHYDTYMQLAQIRAAQGDHKLVAYNLRKALVYNPGWGRAQLMLADALAADGQLEKSIQEYQVYMTTCDPAQKDSLQAVIDKLRGRMRGDAPSADAAAQKKADDAKTPQAGAVALNIQPAPPVAPIALDPRAEEVMKKVVRLYGENKNDSMLVAVREVLAIQKDHPGAYYFGGLGRLKTGEKDKAKINFRKGIPHAVYGAASRYNLGVLLGQEGAREEAVRQLKAALISKGEGFDRKEAERLIELYSNQIAAAPRQRPKQSAAAKPGATEQAAADPASGDVQAVPLDKYAPIEVRIDSMLSMMTVDTLTDAGRKLLLGIRAFTAGRYDDALREFRKVLAENPNGAIAAQCLYNAGICYYRLRLFKDAENQFQLFLNRFPSHAFAPKAAFFKASCFQERGDYAVSERLFREFIQKNKNHEWTARAYERLGDSYVDFEQHKKAIDAFNLALSGSKSNTDKVILNYKLGHSCAQIGDRNRAISYFQTVIDIGEKNGIYMRVPDSYYKIADLRFQQKEWKSALDMYKRVTRKYPAFQETPWGLFQIAGIHRNQKQYREAVDTYKELMEKYPDDYWAKQAQWKLEDTVWEHEFRGAKK